MYSMNQYLNPDYTSYHIYLNMSYLKSLVEFKKYTDSQEPP